MTRHRSMLLALAVRSTLAFVAASSFAQPAPVAPTSVPSTLPMSPGEERVKITVIEVVRLVRVRQSEDQPYQIAKVGMVLDEGAEFQTGPGARVRVTLPPDQTVTIDRLTTCKVLRARIANGGNTAKTELGMPYGRTQYDVEAAGVEHDSAIRSPGATLAVRGTKNMTLFDHGPFAPEASASQPVRFRNLKGRFVNFGTTGQTATMKGSDDSPSDLELALAQVILTPTAAESAREKALKDFKRDVTPLFDFLNLSLIVKSSQGRNRSTEFIEAQVIIALPTDRAVQFQLRWFNVPFADVNFSVVATNGNVVSITNPEIDAGLGTKGNFRGGNGKGGNGVASKSGFGSEIIELPNGFPSGNYTLRAQLAKPTKGGGTVAIDLQFNVIQTDPSLEKRKPVILTLTGDSINPQKPTPVTRTVFVDTDIVREVKQTGAAQSSSKRPQRGTAPARDNGRSKPPVTARR